MKKKIKPTNKEEVNRGNVGILKILFSVEEIFMVQEENPSPKILWALPTTIAWVSHDMGQALLTYDHKVGYHQNQDGED